MSELDTRTPANDGSLSPQDVFDILVAHGMDSAYESAKDNECRTSTVVPASNDSLCDFLTLFTMQGHVDRQKGSGASFREAFQLLMSKNAFVVKEGEVFVRHGFHVSRAPQTPEKATDPLGEAS